MEPFVFNPQEADVFVYIGEINRQGYAKFSQEMEMLLQGGSKKNKVLLCLATFGGDPDAGYRIGRCLQHFYEKQVTLFAPGICKSSGTLTAIAANNLIIGNEGELGPLDIQLRKVEEMGELSSGLDIFKAVNFLENRVIDEFVMYLTSIRYGSGISTRLSADIAAKLVDAVIKPISSQIDPIKIGEHQRAIGIAQKYGELLNEMTDILQKDALATLISGYPSHGFVIDRKEAAKLFKNVFKPCANLLEYLSVIIPLCTSSPLLGEAPKVFKYDKTPTQDTLENGLPNNTECQDDNADPTEPASHEGTEPPARSSSKKRN